MANFVVLRNCFSKLQPSLYSQSISSRFTASIQPGLSNSNTQTALRNTHIIKCSLHHSWNRNQYLHHKIPFMNTITSKHNSTASDDNTPNVHTKSSSSIDEFRVREEQREEEYSKQQPSSTNDEKHDEKIQDTRTKILNAALPFVSNYGWSRETISKGAESIGYPGVVHGMFPNGGIELVHNFYLQCNQQLIEILKVELEKTNQNPIEFVTKAVQIRLQMIEPYLSHWPQALGLMTLPANVPTSLAYLLTLVDDICYYSGDRSVDFGWYSRRIGLATIYKMTEVYMLQDKSLKHEDTWKFLERRIAEGHQIQEMLTMGDVTTKKVVSSAFSTARNILGLDFNRR